MTIMKNRRLEVRTDETTERLVTDAAACLHQTKTAFIEDAVRTAAEKVLARADVTIMSAQVFDAMMSSLDTPEYSPELAKLAEMPRLIRR